MKLLHYIFKILDILTFSAGVYSLFVAIFITKMEVECGIQNITCNAAVQLILLFITALAYLASSFVLFIEIKNNVDCDDYEYWRN